MQKNMQKAQPDVTQKLASYDYIRDYRPIPFWSWNDKLSKDRLCEQIEWMHAQGIGGFFMHARGGLITEYLGEEWMECCDACCDKAHALDMDAYMYDENGWPSGFAGGKLLEKQEDHDRYLTVTTGDFDGAALVSYEITPTKLVRAQDGQSGKRYLNVYHHYAVSTVDILNPDVVEKFLDLTHRAYKKRYGKDFPQKIKGFFTDEPQYFRWDTAYTPMIANYFRDVYKEDILDSLGLLFVEKEEFETFRHKYWSGMQALFLQNFAKKLYDFCEQNHMALTGHYVEETWLHQQMFCCAGAMPFYEYEHIPGIDWLGRDASNKMSPKQVASASVQCGKDRIITETFGCCGWDVTPRELKRILDAQYLHGVNLMCHHLLPSSEYGQRKRDYPQHYTPLNPWINKHFRAFNDCYTRLGALIGHSKEAVNACVLHPITSAYIHYKRNEEWGGIQDYDIRFAQLLDRFAALHLPYHFVDETLLAKMGRVEGDKLVCGQCAYTYWILPDLININSGTLALLRQFVRAGGKLLLMGNAPAYCDGVPSSFPFVSNVTLDEILAAQPFAIDNEAIHATLRTGDDGSFVFAINPTEKEQTFTLAVGDARSVRELKCEDNTLGSPMPLTLTLRPGQSAVLFPCADAPRPAVQKPTVHIGGAQRVAVKPQNILPIDAARFAVEGQAYGEKMPLIQIFAQLLDKRYRGKLRLLYEFESNIDLPELTLYAEEMHTLSVTCNGVNLQKEGTLAHEPMVNRYRTRGKKGKNEIEIVLEYYQDDSVYYALFGEGVTESLRNCMVYDTNIESIYLTGDFGVYPVNVRNGQTADTVLCDGFVLDEQKTQVRDMVRDGYATFAGEITLQSEIDVPAGGCLLQIDGRWQTADIEINGKHRTLLFDTAADISDMATTGKNTVRITLIPSLRNLLGPHHFAPADDPTSVGPPTFDLSGTWKDGMSELLRKSYSLVNLKF